MSKRNQSFAEVLISAPWWISAILLIIGNIGIRVFIPMWFSGQRTPGQVGSMLSTAVTQAMPAVANLFTLAFGGLMFMSIARTLWVSFKEKKATKAEEEKAPESIEVKSFSMVGPWEQKEEQKKQKLPDNKWF